MSGQSQPLREHKGLQWMRLMDKIQKKLLLCPLPFVNFSFSVRAVTESQDVVTHVFRIHVCLCFFKLKGVRFIGLERTPLFEIGCWTCGRTGKPPPFGCSELLELNPAMNFPAVLLLVRSFTSSNFVSQICQISISAPVGNSIFTRWQVGKLESFELRLDRFFGLPNSSPSPSRKGWCTVAGGRGSPPDGPGFTARRLAFRCATTALGWAQDNENDGDSNRGMWPCGEWGWGWEREGIRKDTSDFSKGGWWFWWILVFFFAFGFWNMLENAIVLLTPIGDEWWEAKVLEMSETSPYPRAEPVGATLPRCVMWQCRFTIVLMPWWM